MQILNVQSTSSSAIAERPRCRVGQFWPNVTGRRYFADIIGLSQPLWRNWPTKLLNLAK